MRNTIFKISLPALIFLFCCSWSAAFSQAGQQVGTGMVNDEKNVPNEDDILVFSSTGYITPAEDVQSLEEVIVIRYSTQKKSDVTGSISLVGPEEQVKVKIYSLTKVIQPGVPGEPITGTSIGFGAGTFVRGSGMSTTGGYAPLYVADRFSLISGNCLLI